MRRILWAFAGAVLMTVVAPATTDAAVIQCFDPSISSCKPIGLFSWDQPFDDIFTVNNLSDGFEAPTAGGSFTGVLLTVDPGPFETAVDFEEIGAGAQKDTLAFFFLGITQADLGFTFMTQTFLVSLTSPGSTPIFAEVVGVAEPSALLLLSSGVLVFRAFRRRRR